MNLGAQTQQQRSKQASNVNRPAPAILERETGVDPSQCHELSEEPFLDRGPPSPTPSPTIPMTTMGALPGIKFMGPAHAEHFGCPRYSETTRHPSLLG